VSSTEALVLGRRIEYTEDAMLSETRDTLQSLQRRFQALRGHL
jgi:hypothetical protein